MAKFRKKSPEVEAVQYTGDVSKLPIEINAAIIGYQAGGSCFVICRGGERVECRVEDWIVRFHDGEFEVWKTTDIFEVFEAVDKYPDWPTIELDLAGARFTLAAVNELNERVMAMSPHPDAVNVLLRRLSPAKSGFLALALGKLQMAVKFKDGQMAPGFPRIDILEDNLKVLACPNPQIPDGEYRWVLVMDLDTATKAEEPSAARSPLGALREL